MSGLKLPKRLMNRMIEHARREIPNESCGLLAGRGDTASHLYIIKNLEDSPRLQALNIPADRRVRYFMDEAQLFYAQKNMRDNGLDLLAIFHSHPAGPDVPSTTDVRLAYYPEARYLILSLADPEKPTVRSFRIVDGRVDQEELEITEE
jgi:[CysO sulfur-carrier protein]-S-L-cysteine hydrolase